MNAETVDLLSVRRHAKWPSSDLQNDEAKAQLMLLLLLLVPLVDDSGSRPASGCTPQRDWPACAQ